ncbi:MAG TPA: L,D-transpeptidase [Caldilineaceae bacterium]|nr:L,D-transpeptidase [Caldilineaceae bacterium]
MSLALSGGALLALPTAALAQSAGASTASNHTAYDIDNDNSSDNSIDNGHDEGYDFRLSGPALDTPLETTPTEEISAEGSPAEEVSAEALPDEGLPAETSSAAAPSEAAPPDAGGVPQVSTEEVPPGFDFKLSQMPPLPPGGPVGGPPVDPSATDDVDSRTTAFTPDNLSMLTEIEMPDVDEDERWIRVDLSEQMVIAYEGLEPVRGFIVSTGLPGTPTVTGVFRIRTKVRTQTMTGGSLALGTYYNLPNVEWVQYFYADYGFHGTYWHNNFGQPMSHGCINMTNADAKWLFDWAGPEWDGETIWFAASAGNPGALVIVHE